MAIWFCSDHHFGHENIITFCKRPFRTVDEMNSKMVEIHNLRVKPEDTVYFLGDVAFCDPRRFVSQMNGHKHLIIGNHDHKRMKDLKRCSWGWMKDVHLLETGDSPYIWLSHYAHRSWPNSFHGAWHLYGHSHGLIPDTPTSMDVGVDCHGYGPVSLDQIKHRMEIMKPRPNEIPNP